MASPRSMWSGALSLGLLTVPITIGKTWADEREPNMLTVCAEHKAKIDRTERCGANHSDCTLTKAKAVQLADGTFHTFSDNEISAIEEATKSDALTVLDVQPVYEFPIFFGTGTYYLRPDKKAGSTAEQSFALMVAALERTDYGLLVKWCRSARQRLAVVHHFDGVLLLTTLPFATEWRAPGDQEFAYKNSASFAHESMVDTAVELLDQMSSPDFTYDSYADEGLRLRTEAVEKILGGEPVPERIEQTEQVVPDLMAALRASVHAARDATVTMGANSERKTVVAD